MAATPEVSKLFGAPMSPAEVFREMYKRFDQGAQAAAMATVVQSKGSTGWRPQA